MCRKRGSREWPLYVDLHVCQDGTAEIWIRACANHSPFAGPVPDLLVTSIHKEEEQFWDNLIAAVNAAHDRVAKENRKLKKLLRLFNPTRLAVGIYTNPRSLHGNGRAFGKRKKPF